MRYVVKFMMVLLLLSCVQNSPSSDEIIDSNPYLIATKPIRVVLNWSRNNSKENNIKYEKSSSSSDFTSFPK